MSPPPPTSQVSYATKELELLQLITEPSGKTVEQLAQQMIKYERVQVRAAEVFALDPTKLESMQKIVCDPITRPHNFFSLDDPRVNICMFGPKGAVKVNELKAALARYDEVLKKQCVTFEECVDLSNDACGFSDTCLIVMDSHFEAVCIMRLYPINLCISTRYWTH